MDFKNLWWDCHQKIEWNLTQSSGSLGRAFGGGPLNPKLLNPELKHLGFEGRVAAQAWLRKSGNSAQANEEILFQKPYLKGQGDLVSGLIMGITRVTIWVIGVISLPSK